MSGADRNADEELLASFTAFVFDHPDPVVALFGDNLAGWGSEWVGLEPQPGVASDQLVKTVNSTIESARDLVQLFAEHRHSRFWEQTYDASDGLVSDDMLSCYGFVELLGPRGPFVSTRIRGGLGLYGANITYPLHHHGPDEVYLPVSGAARSNRGRSPTPASAGAPSTMGSAPPPQPFEAREINNASRYERGTPER